MRKVRSMSKEGKKYKGLSLFTGAGGMDTGFVRNDIEVVWANELVAAAAQTFSANHPNTEMIVGDINEHYDDLPEAERVDIVFGGPPCQGFSVAGKMNPEDPRSQMIFAFLNVVAKTRPSAFVMENVKALGSLGKWSEVRDKYLEQVDELEYVCAPFICVATDYGVPQKRERVFFIGMKKDIVPGENTEEKSERLSQTYGRHLDQKKRTAPPIRKVLADLGRAGTEKNPLTCTAKITYTKKPVWRPSPYAGMLFNGSGRPVNLDGWCNTLTASMGGAMTPIIDEECLYGDAAENWVVLYHAEVAQGKVRPTSEPLPSRMRRMTLREAVRVQTFPDDYIWPVAKSAAYKQIGNAVPCNLAEAISGALCETMEDFNIKPK